MTDGGDVRESTYEFTVSSGEGVPKVGRLLVVPTVLVKKSPVMPGSEPATGGPGRRHVRDGSDD